MSTDNIKAVVQEKIRSRREARRLGTRFLVLRREPLLGHRGMRPHHLEPHAEGEAGSVPEAAMRASLGCGNPTALAKLAPGETVLDLGSGGGIDVLLSAKRVGPTGKAYGLDMTDEMLALAEENRQKVGADERGIPQRRN